MAFNRTSQGNDYSLPLKGHDESTRDKSISLIASYQYVINQVQNPVKGSLIEIYAGRAEIDIPKVHPEHEGQDVPSQP